MPRNRKNTQPGGNRVDTQWPGFFNCPVCRKPYDLDESKQQLPVLYGKCGHTLCETCWKDRLSQRKGNLFTTSIEYLPCPVPRCTSTSDDTFWHGNAAINTRMIAEMQEYATNHNRRCENYSHVKVERRLESSALAWLVYVFIGIVVVLFYSNWIFLRCKHAVIEKGALNVLDLFQILAIIKILPRYFYTYRNYILFHLGARYEIQIKSLNE